MADSFGVSQGPEQQENFCNWDSWTSLNIQQLQIRAGYLNQGALQKKCECFKSYVSNRGLCRCRPRQVS